MIERTLITTPYGFDSTADDVIAGIDLAGRRAIVTGASSGIGIATARALARAGAEVTLAVRDAEAGAATANELEQDTGRAVRVGRLDLADLASVGAFASAWDGPLDLLVNNAGVMMLPSLALSPVGVEMHFAINHLGHFALATGLHDALAASGNARIVSLSSVGHLYSPVVFDDVSFASRDYDPMLAYAQSKTANVLFAVEATLRWTRDGITANAVHPGAILETNLTRHLDRDVLQGFVDSGNYAFKTTAQGASTSTLVAAAPQLDGIGGRYFEDCNEAPIVDAPDLDGRSGVAAYALDAANAERLWELSERTIG